VLDQTKEELRALAASLMTAQEDERGRIARELHDDLAQRLASLEIEISNLQREPPEEQKEWPSRLEALRQQVAALADNIRDLSHRLHPTVLEDLGLHTALTRLVEDFERTHGLAARIKCGALPAALPLTTTTAVYRIVQEAFRNAVKARARLSRNRFRVRDGSGIASHRA
jgi:signal transduction histidine kinase